MPNYDFKCLVCGVVEERLVRMAERQGPVTCKCGGPMTRHGFPCPRLNLHFSSYDPRSMSRAQARMEQEIEGITE